MRRTVRTASAVVIACLALAGCSGTSEPATVQPLAAGASTPAGTSVAPSSAAPSPTVLTRAAAGKLYLQLVAPSNKALDALIAEEQKPNPSLARLKAKSKTLGDTLVVLLRQVSAAAWPANVQVDIDKLADEIGLELTAARAAQKARSRSAYDAAWAAYESSGTAQKIRAKLGLGEVPA